jgi:hypothetical protein
MIEERAQKTRGGKGDREEGSPERIVPSDSRSKTIRFKMTIQSIFSRCQPQQPTTQTSDQSEPREKRRKEMRWSETSDSKRSSQTRLSVIMLTSFSFTLSNLA